MPMVGGSAQSTAGGGKDGYVVLFGETGQPTYSTFIGGTKDEHAVDVKFDGAGNMIVGGDTESSNFTTVRPFQDALRGKSDFFLNVYTPQRTLAFASYYGGTQVAQTNDELGAALSVAPGNEIVFAGETIADDFPLTANAYRTTRLNFRSGAVVKFAPSYEKSVLAFSGTSYGVVENATATITVTRTGGIGALRVDYRTSRAAACRRPRSS
jgi:hypothetical protein